MGANPHANGGVLLRDLELPDFRDYAVDVSAHGTPEFRADARARRVPARRVPRQRGRRRTSGCSARTRPRRTASTRCTRRRARRGRRDPADRRHLAPHGRVMEILSEHDVPGLARGLPAHGPARVVLVLRGVHAHRRLDVQPARQVARDDAEARVAPQHRVAELPADVARVAPGPQRIHAPGSGLHRPRREQEADVVRVYLPPDANCLLSVADHCLRTRDYVNVIVAGKQPQPTWLSMDDAELHCTRGVGIWEWASNDDGERAGRRDGLRGRCADARDARRGRPAARSTSRR